MTYQKTKTKICAVCGNDFFYKHINHACCSRGCGTEYRKGITATNKQTVICKTCKTEFKVKNSKFMMQAYFFCCRDCYGIHRSELMKDEKNNPTMNKGHTQQSREKMSRSASLRIRQNKSTGTKTSVSGKRNDLNNVFFRSSWEANYARYLNHENIPWEFEPKTFYFKNIKRGSLSYTPDFYLKNEGCFVELKGYFNSKDRGKIKRFKKQYPKEFSKLRFVINTLKGKGYDFIISLNEKAIIYSYKDIEKEFKNKINHWEFSSNSSEGQKNKIVIKRAMKYLEKEGYFCDYVGSLTFDNYNCFGIFDIIAVKKGSILFVQCKTNRPATKKPLQEFTNKHNLYGACFTWYDRKGFLIQYYIPGKKQPKRVDLRKE